MKELNKNEINDISGGLGCFLIAGGAVAFLGISAAFIGVSILRTISYYSSMGGGPRAGNGA